MAEGAVPDDTVADGEVCMWFNPRCSKCRQTRDLLGEHGIDPTLVHYLDDAPTRAELERVLTMLGTDDPRVIIRTGESRYGELGLEKASRDELLDAMAANPILIERPIVLRGDRAVVGRPPENVLGLLD